MFNSLIIIIIIMIIIMIIVKKTQELSGPSLTFIASILWISFVLNVAICVVFTFLEFSSAITEKHKEISIYAQL